MNSLGAGRAKYHLIPRNFLVITCYLTNELKLETLI